MMLFACAALLIGALVYVFKPAYVSEGSGDKTRLQYLEERRDAIYENLRDLNFEHKAGKFTEADHEIMRASLESEAAGVLAEIAALLARDVDGVLVNRMAETTDGESQRMTIADGSYIRDHFFGTDPRLRKLVEHLSDEQLRTLRRGGHDYRKVYAAYHVAVGHTGAPTAVLAQTVKGWALGPSVEARNITHQAKKMSFEELKIFRDRLQLPISDDKLTEDPPYYHPGPDSPEVQYMVERRRALGGFVPKPHTPFQWFGQNGVPELRRKVGLLRDALRKSGAQLRWHDPAATFVEGIASRGDRRIGRVIERVWRSGATFQEWSERFDLAPWLDAMDAEGLDPDWYVTRHRHREEVLPWSHISAGLHEDFLWDHWQAALAEHGLPDCRWTPCYDCGVCTDHALEHVVGSARPPAGGSQGTGQDLRAGGLVPVQFRELARAR